MPLYSSPATREVRIIRRQGHKDVKMLRQDNYCIDSKWAFAACRAERGPQYLNMIDKHCRAAVCQGNRKEVRATALKVTSVGDHGFAPSRMSLRSCGLRCRMHLSYLSVIASPLKSTLAISPT